MLAVRRAADDDGWDLFERQPSGKWRAFERGLDDEELADRARDLIDDGDLDPGEVVLVIDSQGGQVRRPAAFLLRPDGMRAVGYVIGAQPVAGRRPDRR